MNPVHTLSSLFFKGHFNIPSKLHIGLKIGPSFHCFTLKFYMHIWYSSRVLPTSSLHNPWFHCTNSEMFTDVYELCSSSLSNIPINYVIAKGDQMSVRQLQSLWVRTRNGKAKTSSSRLTGSYHTWLAVNKITCPVSSCCIISCGWFSGVWILCADISELSVPSSYVVWTLAQFALRDMELNGW